MAGGSSDEPADPMVVEQTVYGERTFYINCPGGSVYAGLAIYDTIQFVKPQITTTCVGIAMSLGALLLAAGTSGKRTALPNAKILVHQLWGGFEGQASDIGGRHRERAPPDRCLPSFPCF